MLIRFKAFINRSAMFVATLPTAFWLIVALIASGVLQIPVTISVLIFWGIVGTVLYFLIWATLRVTSIRGSK